MSEPLRGRPPAPSARTGLEVRVRRISASPVVSLRVWIPGGSRSETVPGQALAAGRSLTEGTLRRDWRKIADEAEALGMDVGCGANILHHNLGLDALAEDWRQALDWMAELVREPMFPEDRVAWVRRQIGAELQGLADRPEVRSAWGFLEHLYAPHPMSRPIQGTPEGLERLTTPDCAGFHRRAMARSLIVTAAGDLDEGAVEARIGELFSDLEMSSEPVPQPPHPVGLPRERREVKLPGGESVSDQAHLFAGHLTLPRTHPDYEALELAGVVLGSGAGLTGRIPARVREQEGLAYTARASLIAGSGLDPGRLVVYVGTSMTTVGRAEVVVREELARLAEGGITADELEEARSYLLGREPFERETARQWAELLADSVLYGLPLDDPGWRQGRLENVTLAGANAALRRHLRPAELKVTVGVPA